ncbi:MAG: hypothetical protein GXP62_19625 [Oligoflexia bacterium]|nr:hypothetical protein [Oligoflexia bacterium]
MSSMGVKPLDRDRSRPGGRKKVGRKDPAPKQAAPKQAAPKQAAPSSPPPVVTASVAADELREIRQQAQRVDGLLRERDQLRAALADRDQALAVQVSRVRGLDLALARAGGDPLGDQPSASAVLQARGVLGATEQDAALRGFADARLGAQLLGRLSVSDPVSLTAFLDDRLVLQGGCEHCPVVPGRVSLTVPPSRCEVCRGQDLSTSIRRFVDACLVNGLTRLILVGGRPLDHILLRILIVDRRLALTLVPGGLGRGSEQIAADIGQVQAVICWMDRLADPSLADAYGVFDVPLVRVRADAVGPLLDAVSRVLPAALHTRD